MNDLVVWWVIGYCAASSDLETWTELKLTNSQVCPSFLPTCHRNVWVEIAIVVLLALFVFLTCYMCSVRIIIEKEYPESYQGFGTVQIFPSTVVEIFHELFFYLMAY